MIITSYQKEFRGKKCRSLLQNKWEKPLQHHLVGNRVVWRDKEMIIEWIGGFSRNMLFSSDSEHSFQKLLEEYSFFSYKIKL